MSDNEEFDPMLDGDDEEDELEGMTIKDANGEDVEDENDDDEEMPLESERE